MPVCVLQSHVAGVHDMLPRRCTHTVQAASPLLQIVLKFTSPVHEMQVIAAIVLLIQHGWEQICVNPSHPLVAVVAQAGSILWAGGWAPHAAGGLQTACNDEGQGAHLGQACPGK